MLKIAYFFLSFLSLKMYQGSELLTREVNRQGHPAANRLQGEHTTLRPVAKREYKAPHINMPRLPQALVIFLLKVPLAYSWGKN